MFMQESGTDNLDRSFHVSHSGHDERDGAVVLAGRSKLRDGARRRALQTFLGSVEFRGPVIVAAGFGPMAWAGWLWRSVVRRATLLVYLSEPPRKRLGWRARLLLRRVDGVLVDGHAAGLAMVALGHSAHRIGFGTALDRYLAMRPTRLPERVRRVIVIGALTPASGTYDLLRGLATWSTGNADEVVDVIWIGEGQLSAVLAAQPVPDNMTQTFLPMLDEDGIAAVLEGGGMLAVPSLADGGRGHVAEALAAGLPVLGSRRNGEVRRHVTDEVTGWLFDPMAPGDLADAIGRALGANGDRLAQMAVRARAAMTVPGGVVGPARADRRADRPTRQAVRSVP